MFPALSTRISTLLALPLALCAQAQNSSAELYAPGRLIVGVEADVRSVEEIVASLRADPATLDVSPLFDRSIWLVELVEPGDELATAERLSGIAGVRYAERDALMRALDVPNDPQYSSQWAFPIISAPQAWGNQKLASNIVVAVIDTGVEYTHPDLAANIWTNSNEIPGNAIDDDGNGFVDDVHGYDFVNSDGDPIDDHFHGTHVAGTIGAATNNGTGVSGMCWSVQIMAVKMLDSSGNGLASTGIQSLNYARLNGARLTNNSWGGYGYSQGLKDAIAATGNAGMLCVCAAGNDTNDNDLIPAYPASYDLVEIISVGASTPSDAMASFSNFGLASVDLFAPGTGILSTYIGGTYQQLDGTSMACPHVAGAVCLMLAHCPTLTMPQIKNALLVSVDALPQFAPRCVSGGRLNLAQALTQACDLPTAYCTAGTSTSGCAALMYATGTPSASASSGFTLTVLQVEGQRSGIVFYGINGKTALPWATGSTSFMCVKSPTQRTFVQNSGGALFVCDGSFSIDFLAFMAANPTALGQPLAASQRYDAQAWYRDPPAPKTTNLSNAFDFLLVP